ncbi:FAD-dependent oxidoreductase [Calditrichota bacterium LG25]
MIQKNYEYCILGTGPAGLGTALELVKNGLYNGIVIDKNDRVGGLARTIEFEGARYDIGPHRFFTKKREINKIWHEILGRDFIPVNRLTRIYYKNKFFNYPIKLFDTLTKLGLVESTHAIVSFGIAKFKLSKKNIETFEDWISDKFGNKLYKTFFKTYTEKVWGIPCDEISAEWAAQRIKGLDIIEVLKNAIIYSNKNKPKTLVEQFDYPILGAGQMYEVMAERIVENGVDLQLESKVIKIKRTNDKIESIIFEDRNKNKIEIKAKFFFNSIPLTHFFKLLEPLESEKILHACNSLYYRDHITVNITLKEKNIFTDQWIYVHDPEVKMARIANYKNFSKKMINNENYTNLSIEYFVFKEDELWKMPDKELIDLAEEELFKLKLIKKNRIISSFVVRETESYPTYYLGFKKYYNILKNRMDDYKNIYPIGRGGLYKYNNQDHSMYSGILAAKNYISSEKRFNLWNINIDAEYLESAKRDEI